MFPSSIPPRAKPSLEECSAKRARSETEPSANCFEVISVVGPVFLRLLELRLISSSVYLELRDFIQPNGRISEQEVNSKCRDILKKIFPGAIECEWRTLSLGVETKLNEQREKFIKQLAEVKEPPYARDNSREFPIFSDSVGQPEKSYSLYDSILCCLQKKSHLCSDLEISKSVYEVIINLIEKQACNDSDLGCLSIFELLKRLETILELPKPALRIRYGELVLPKVIPNLPPPSEYHVVHRYHELVNLFLELPFKEIKDQLITQLKKMYDSKTLSILESEHIEGFIQKIDPTFKKRIPLKIKFKDGMFDVTEETLDCLQKSSNFFRDLHNSRFIKDGILELSPITLKQMSSLILFAKKTPYQKLKFANFQEWLDLLQIGHRLMFAKLERFFDRELLREELISPTAEALEEFVKAQLLLAPLLVPLDGSPPVIPLEEWISIRNQLLSDYIDGLGKEISVQFFNRVRQFESDLDNELKWMAISHLSIRARVETFRCLSVLDNLKSLTLFTGPYPKSNGVLGLLPRLKFLSIFYDGIVNKQGALFGTSENLEELDLHIHNYTYMRHWRVVAGCSRNLRRLTFHIHQTRDKEDEWKRRSELEWYAEWIKPEDAVRFPNLRVIYERTPILIGTNIRILNAINANLISH